MGRRHFLGLLSGVPLVAIPSVSATAPVPLEVSTRFDELGERMTSTYSPGVGEGIVDTIETLRRREKGTIPLAFVAGYLRPGDGGGGSYWCDTTDKTSKDNGGTIIVATDGCRWKLAASAIVTVRQFGAVGDGHADDSRAIQTAIDHATQDSGVVYFPPGSYYLATPLRVAGGIKLLGSGGFFDYSAHASVLKPASEAVVAKEPDRQTSQGLYVQGLTFEGGRNPIDLGKFHIVSITDCSFIGWSGNAICLYNGEKLEFRNLFFYPNRGVAESCFSFCKKADSTLALTGADSSMFTDRVLMENIFLSPAPGGSANGVRTLVRSGGQFAHVTLVNVVAHATHREAFDLYKMQWCTADGITVDGGGVNGTPQEATFSVSNQIEGCVFNGLSLVGGEFFRRSSVKVGGAIWSTVFNGCQFGTGDNVKSFGFNWATPADGSVMFNRCSGSFYSAMASVNLLRASLSTCAVGCSFAPSNLPPTATSDSVGNDIVLSALSSDTAGASTVAKAVLARIAVGGGSYTEPLHVRKDHVWLNKPIAFSNEHGESLPQTIAVGSSNAPPNGRISANPGSLYLAYDASSATGRLYVKEMGSGNTGWVGK